MGRVMVLPDAHPPSPLLGMEHLIVVFCDDCTVDEVPHPAARATECLAYRGTPAGEDRAALWTGYGAALAAAGYRVLLGTDAPALARALRSGGLPEVSIVTADRPGLQAVVDALPDPPAKTLVALALGDRGRGRSEEPDADDLLGAPAGLLLLSAVTPPGWVGEETFDHTSLLQLCERWTAARGNAVPADLPSERRELVGDLTGALTLREAPLELTTAAEGRRLTRPTPYFPIAELRADGDKVALRLANVGPTATRPVRLTVDDGSVSHHTVRCSSYDAPAWVELPVRIQEGRYDVTVRGPDHFRRRFAGTVPSPVGCSCEHFGAGDPWFPDLVLTVSHTTTVPVFFWLERRLGTRFGGARSERLLGPRRTASFREQPGARTHGWYDLRVTTSADPTWAQEYAGHLHAGNRPSLTR
jgi:hypothetical protein